MENDLIRIEQRNAQRRAANLAVEHDRREAQRRRDRADDAMIELRRSTRHHIARVAAQMASLDRGITDWANRYHEAKRGVR